MLQPEATVLYEGSIMGEDCNVSRYDTITAAHSKEYFNLIENGHVPVIPVTNANFISAMRNSNGETLLITAARLGHAKIVESLVSEIDIEETDNDGWTALLCASHNGHADCTKLLLAAGASIDQPDLMGWTPLMWACYKNHLDGKFNNFNNKVF